ncbi:MAG: hypothetical protein KDL87_15150, partial [Verrucomicrobiae bacterium]|nr:hypothetical protein [Verrucomicrobiae bacterium]
DKPVERLTASMIGNQWGLVISRMVLENMEVFYSNSLKRTTLSMGFSFSEVSCKEIINRIVHGRQFDIIADHPSVVKSLQPLRFWRSAPVIRA